jgi:predicted oxidoreductase
VQPSVLVTSGGIGGNLRSGAQGLAARPAGRTAANHMIAGVPAHVDGRMIAITEAAGGRVINTDRMWHYTEGVKNWNPIWPNHGIRILPGPSSMWFDAEGNRLKPPCMPGFDTLSTLREILATGHDHSWFVMTQKILKKEVALSGSEQNPGFCGEELAQGDQAAAAQQKATPAVEAFKRHGEDFIVANSWRTWLRK